MYYVCFAILLVLPLFLIAVGLKWYLKPPAFKTGKLAYRTEVTERSPEVWFFAHTHCGKLWARYGVITGVISVLLMIFLDQVWQGFWLWVLGAQTLLLCVTIFLIDYLSKNLFDEEGRRIEKRPAIEEPSQPEE